MRIPHFLKHNIKGESPQQCIFFDTETTEVELSPYKKQLVLKFGWACFTRRIRHGAWSKGAWFKFTYSAEFWTWVEAWMRKGTKTYIFAHNLVFDLTVTKAFSTLQDMGFKLVKAIVDDPPTILLFRKDKASICLIDSFNYFHSSLAELGQSTGLAKLSMPLETDSSDSWDSYAKRDVDVLKNAMLSYLEFIKTNDLGNFQYTIASQAFTAYRHKFMKEKVFIDGNEKALALARASYHGGRTEAFFIGKKTGDFYLLDVNSMYPFVMSIYSFPSVLRGVYHRISIKELTDCIAEAGAIADVTLLTHDNALALSNKQGLLFPTGKFRAILTTPEIGYALDKGYLQKVHRAAIYTLAPLFEDYIKTIYHLRKEYQAQGNQAFEYLCKIMLNSLYGKFGQSGRVYEDVGETLSDEIKVWDEWDVDTHEINKYRQFGGIIQTFRKEGESFNSHPAISAHVTAYARMWLWKLMTTAGLDNVYYVDTDSLVVNKEGYDILSSLYAGVSLGELKLVKRFTHLIIHGPKDYEFDDMVKIKGVGLKAVKTGPNSFTQDKFSKFKTMLKKGNLDSMVVTNESKHLKREYLKGDVLPDGKVVPFQIESEEFDPVKHSYNRLAKAELFNFLLSVGEGSKVNTWLKGEIEDMETELGKRSIPYKAGHLVGKYQGYVDFEGYNIKQLDARLKVFSEYLKTHS